MYEDFGYFLVGFVFFEDFYVVFVIFDCVYSVKLVCVFVVGFVVKS